MAKGSIGSSFTDFIVEEGIKDDVDLLTFKKVLADEIESRMKECKVTMTMLAHRMDTSRNQVYRLLDETDAGITLTTLSRAARALDWSIVDLLAATDRKKQKPAVGKPRRGART